MQDKSVFSTCDALGVENIIWRPLRRNKTLLHNWELLVTLSKKYNKTQSQIILNWICNLGYRPMVFSTKRTHIDENLNSLDFSMESSDYQKLTDYRPRQYSPPEISWETKAIDTDIVLQANNFEDYIK